MGMSRCVVATVALLATAPALAQQRFITVASTTSTEQSGLFRHLLPIFEKQAGFQARVVALGTGQALGMGRRGDADVVFVHARALEERFIDEGFGVKRFEVMYNEFVLVGPKSDPARAGGSRDIVAALHRIKAAAAPFASRGTGAARTSRNWSCGRQPGSTSPRTRAPGTATPARAWGRRSTSPPG